MTDQTENDLLLSEAFNGAPDFYDIPEEMEKAIQEQVSARERFFWMGSRRIKDDVVTRSMLRRAIYAEVRCFESESRLSEMALICRAAKQRVEALEQQVRDLAGATGKDADLVMTFKDDSDDK